MREATTTLFVDGPCRIIQYSKLPAVALRLHRPTPQQIRALDEALGFALPVEPNTVTGEVLQAIWKAPGEWLLTGDAAPGMVERIERACAQTVYHVADMSGAYTVFELAGPSARDVLAQICSLDFHPRVFKAGECAQSLFAQVRGLIQQLDEQPRYRLFVDRSYSRHVELCLKNAADSAGELK